jgi:hypothetical protein
MSFQQHGCHFHVVWTWPDGASWPGWRVLPGRDGRQATVPAPPQVRPARCSMACAYSRPAR